MGKSIKAWAVIDPGNNFFSATKVDIGFTVKSPNVNEVMKKLCV